MIVLLERQKVAVNEGHYGFAHYEIRPASGLGLSMKAGGEAPQ